MVKVLFFARLRELLGVSEKTIEWSKSDTVLALATTLADNQGGDWGVLLAEDTVYAVNQKVVDRNAMVHGGDEVAFFPPVTGG